ncbi:protein kinase-like protein [Roseimicrobium gellanilyticum]|uniref:Protein kinase-like protein n=1 Tax=Roseimicrobium gellanilyticum TaxID=748857 RepID=A0A366H499_9BACT|nr:serine/threonine-protein kinase [Roseimicrobium gellanilyticum]RBP36124.1 protein kinase-like protein [Roseimicrobium gellanilyticum]
MAWVALNCPQCSAPLPRVAIWRSVKCASCGALITRTESVVNRDTFRQSLIRARQHAGAFGGDLECGGDSYRLMQHLGNGEISQVYLAQRLGPMPFLATIKVSTAPTAARQYAREAEILRDLQAAENGAASAYCLQHLPVVVAQGVVAGSSAKHALVMKHPNGFWGSLAALNERFPQGLDPRHAVWIWRRLLDVLQFIHAQGWSHGDVRPEHGLVHPADHGVRMIGWGSAQKSASTKDQGRDLQRSARVVLVLLSGSGAHGSLPGTVPRELSQLVTQASEDEAFCRQHGAAGLDSLLRSTARSAFGPPSFVHLAV